MRASVRHLYETEDDLEKERKVADFIEFVWKAKLYKMPRSYRIDFAAMINGRLRGWVEVKCRDASSETYPTIILSVQKWSEGRRLARETGTRFFLVIQLSDGIYCSDETATQRDVKFGGRTDRNIAEDMEPVVHIPISDFKRLGESVL